MKHKFNLQSSLIKTLKSRDSKIDPWGTPFWMSDQLLRFKVRKMQANPDKFQVLAVGKKTFDKNMKICIQISTLSCEETVKLLGIEIDYQLNFDIHRTFASDTKTEVSTLKSGCP
jgi:hypothetical protein